MEGLVPGRSNARESATLEAARSSNWGRGCWGPAGRGPPWECRAARGHQARPEEPQEPSWGAAKAATLTVLLVLDGEGAAGGDVRGAARGELARDVVADALGLQHEEERRASQQLAQGLHQRLLGQRR